MIESKQLFWFHFLLVIQFRTIRSDFCSEYMSLSGNKTKSLDNLKFIATKDKVYLYLYDTKAKEMVYELDINCDDTQCPRIESNGQDLSQVFGGFSKLKIAYFQNGLTYLLANGSQIVSVFENNSKLRDIGINDFWKNVTHVKAYQWEKNRKVLKSRFVPTKSFSSFSNGYPIIYSHDNYISKTVGRTVELLGQFESIYLISDGKYYTFGDYLVPFEFKAYLPLPNGNALFNNIDEWAQYMRKEGLEYVIYSRQNLNYWFGCDGNPLPPRNLTDTQSVNHYPTIDKSN